MVEKKAKLATKKVATANTKTSSAVAGKPKTTKAAVTATTKKVAAKKTKTLAAVAEPKKTKPPAVKKSPTPAAEIKAPVKKAATTKAKPTAAAIKAVMDPTPEERYRMVETAAYYIAEQHGFQGRSDEHWAAAESQIAAKLGQ